MKLDVSPLIEIEIEAKAPDRLGNFPDGERRLTRFSGGTFKGDNGLQGILGPGGLDWQTVRADGTTEISAHYCLHTDAGDTIEIQSDGLRVASPEIVARMATGASVDPSDYYFRTFIRFGTASERYARLNQRLGIAWGERERSTVRIHVYEVL